MIMTKVPEHGRPHDFTGSMSFGLESAVSNWATHIPIVTYDEGLGVINSYKSNPQNASFAEYAGAKCYPTSKINRIFAKFEFSLTKEALETDKILGCKFATSTIHTSFMDGQLAEDEVSTLDLNEILELQNESTDRQTFPLYNAIDLKDGKSNALLDLEVGQEGLDTDLEIEGVTFLEDDYYDCLHYYTNGNKLRTIATPLRWSNLTRAHPRQTIYVSQQSNTKFMNPYAYLGFFINFPLNAWKHQWGKAGDTTDIAHMQVDYNYRYLELNHEFNHALQ